jgi:hypothetical protein
VDEARSVRQFWFGALPLSAAQLQQRMRFWFGNDPTPLRRGRDEGIRTRSPAAGRAGASLPAGPTGRGGA